MYSGLLSDFILLVRPQCSFLLTARRLLPISSKNIPKEGKDIYKNQSNIGIIG